VPSRPAGVNASTPPSSRSAHAGAHAATVSASRPSPYSSSTACTRGYRPAVARSSSPSALRSSDHSHDHAATGLVTGFDQELRGLAGRCTARSSSAKSSSRGTGWPSGQSRATTPASSASSRYTARTASPSISGSASSPGRLLNPVATSRAVSGRSNRPRTCSTVIAGEATVRSRPYATWLSSHCRSASERSGRSNNTRSSVRSTVPPATSVTISRLCAAVSAGSPARAYQIGD
jgi:hypothetical protein